MSMLKLSLQLKNWKIIFFVLLNSLMGSVFIYSAYAKLYPIEPFELTFVELNIANWKLAPFIARLFISIEYFIGTMLILNLNARLFSKLAIFILSAFSIYLIMILWKYGNEGNCGCFGMHLKMTPLQALLKNILMMGILLLTYFNYAGWNFRKYKVIVGLIAIISLVMPPIQNYVDLDYSEQYLFVKEDRSPLGLDSLINHAQVHPAPANLKKGKHIIAFMSLSCPHCRIASKKMGLMKSINPSIPFYFVLNGEESMLSEFFKDTKADNIPYSMLLGKPFVYMAGLRLPSIYFVQNDTVMARIDYISLQQSEIENWLEK